MITKDKLNKRKSAIEQLVKTQPIENQAALIDLLEKNYGIKTNQAAISRDLRSLGITRKVRGDLLVYELPTIDVVNEILQYAVKSIEHNETTIVINTVAGTAAFVGDFLDVHQTVLNILGTLAGENVVFVLPRSVNTIKNLHQELLELFKIKE